MQRVAFYIYAGKMISGLWPTNTAVQLILDTILRDQIKHNYTEQI